MKLIKILICSFTAYLNIIVVFNYIRTPMDYNEATIGLNFLVAMFLLNISFEEYKKM